MAAGSLREPGDPVGGLIWSFSTYLSHMATSRRCPISALSWLPVMGSSGVAKTTLLRLILGLEKPDGGKITGVPGKKSAVFQESRLIPELTIRGNLRLVLGNRFPETEITAMLTRLDLTDCLDTPAANLSGGQQRRSALARALLYGGELLLVRDEPFRGLHEANRRKALDAIRAYPKEAIVLLVTHSREDAEALGAEIIEI